MPSVVKKLKSDPTLWPRVIRHSLSHRISELPDVASAAFDVMDQWTGIADSKDDKAVGGGVSGALTALEMYSELYPDKAYAACRRIGGYFASANINVAFGTIRRFENGYLSQFKLFVADQLISVAACPTPTPSPIPMTVRGIAFRVLFDLDPFYKHWPALRIARDECVRGLLAWSREWEGPSSSKCRSVAARILRYSL